MEPKILRNPSDTWVKEGSTTPQPEHPRLWLQDANPAHYSYMFWSPVWPIGQDVVIRTAKLRLKSGNTFPGAVTLQAQRIADQVSFGRLIYSGRPKVLSGIASQAKTDAAAGTWWELDLAPLIQAAALGGAWWGIRLHAIGSDVGKWFYSGEAADPDNRPTLELEWSVPSAAPSGLSPKDGGVVSTTVPLFSWIPPAGGLTDAIVAHEFELYTDESMITKAWSSGIIPSADPQLDSSWFWGNDDASNPSLEATDISAWRATLGSPGLARNTTIFQSGVASLAVTKNATAGDMEVGHKGVGTAGFPVMPGFTYTERIYFRAAATARSTVIYMDWYDENGVFISTTTGATVNDSTTAWTLNTITTQAPDNAYFLDVRYRIVGAAANEVHYMDNHYINPGTVIYGGITAGTSRYWRVRRINNAGIVSKWSPLTLVHNINTEVGAITNPPASPNNFVEDPTPPFSWTFPNQKRIEMMVYDRDFPAVPLWTSGPLTTPDQIMEPIAGVIDDPTINYRLAVRLWDFQNRVSNGIDKDYVEVTRDFTYRRVSAVTAATNLSHIIETPFPALQFNFKRTTIPDKWVIEKDGKFLPESYEGADLLVAGTTDQYRWRDPIVAGRTPHTYTFHAVQNGQTSLNSPSITVTNKITSLWIAKKDTSDPVMLVNFVNNPDEDPAGEAHTVKGGHPPVLIMEDEGGYMGTVTGFIEDGVVTGLTAKQMHDNFKRLKKMSGTKMTMLWINEGLEVVLYNMKSRPIAVPGGGTVWSVSFSYFQTDFS